MPQAGDTIYATRASGLLVAYLQRNVTVQALADATEVGIAFDTAVVDRQGGWSSGVNPSRYTPNVAGWYEVSGMTAYAASTAGTRRSRLFLNGVSVDGSFIQTVYTLTNITMQLPVSPVPVLFNGTTDYVELIARQSSGGSLNTTLGATCPWMKLIYLGSA